MTRRLPDKRRVRNLRNLNRSRAIQDPVFMAGYSDASFKPDPPHQGGGWGIWVRDNKVRILRAGVCPDWVKTSHQAEACAVWAAIHTALTHLDTQKCNILVVKTDCSGVARLFGWDGFTGNSRDDDVTRILRRAFEMAHEKRIKLVVKWVKGHQRLGGDNTPGYLNHRVDKLAGHARTKREAFKVVIPVTDKSTIADEEGRS